MIYSFRTSTYARNVFLYGNTKLSDIPAEYQGPVKQYAANTFTTMQLDNAFNNGWITQEEYDSTVAYIVTL